MTKNVREARAPGSLKKGVGGAVNILAERVNQIRTERLLSGKEMNGDRPSQGWGRDLSLYTG